MARANPRNVEIARQNIINACKRPKFADNVEYSKPVGNSSITGPSIRFAEHCLREWGNIDSDISVVYEDRTVRRVKIYLTDLQTGSHFSKEVSIKKTVERKSKKGRTVISERLNSYNETVYIVEATDDELANKEAALISKAIRNEGLRLIPADIIEEAMEIAQDTRAGQIKQDPVAFARKVIDAFSDLGVKASQLEKYVGCPVEECSPAQLDELRKIHGTIKSGDATWHSYVSQESAEEVPVQVPVQKKTPAKKATSKKAKPEPEGKSCRDELEALCLDESISWAKVEEWASGRKLDVSKDEDCCKVINAWDTCKEFIKG
jgi:hypothetical protein